MKKIIITVTSDTTEKVYGKICEGFLKKNPDLEFVKNIDDSIIGGFIADFDGEVYDLSIASQIKKMQTHLEG